MGDALHVSVYILAGFAAIEAIGLVVLWQLLARSQRELDELRQRNDARSWLLSGGREAVKTVWNTANLVRKEGFGAAVRSSIEASRTGPRSNGPTSRGSRRTAGW